MKAETSKNGVPFIFSTRDSSLARAVSTHTRPLEGCTLNRLGYVATQLRGFVAISIKERGIYVFIFFISVA